MTRSSSGGSDVLRSLAAPAAWSLYVAVPAAGWGWLDGVPLRWLEAAALALVWWTWAAGRPLPRTHVLAAVAIAKLALAGVFVDRGFAARYYANDAWTPPAERSIEFPREPFTRRDERLAFGTRSAPDLPLYFHNDTFRWNYYRPDEPKRDELPYSVEWTGFLRIENGSAAATFYVESGPGTSAELLIDDQLVVALDRGSPRTGSVTLDSGWHAVTVRVTAPQGASRRIEAGEIIDGARRPFDSGHVFLQPVGSVRLAIDPALRWLTSAGDVVLLSWLALVALRTMRRTRRETRIVRLLWLGALVEAFVYAYRYVDRLVVLSGGNDWLTYESFARMIALGDIIGGGQQGPFYYQPLYPYFVAVTHVLFGEDLFGVVLVQRLLLAATIAWVAAMTRRLFGARAGWIALVGGGAFLYAKAGRWTEVLLSEPLFMPLLVGWVAMLVKIATGERSCLRAAAAGVVGGLATLTRPTLLAGWPPILLLFWASIRSRRGTSVAALLLIVMAAVVNLATLRNWIVADRIVLSPTSFGPSLRLGNEPTRPLEPTPDARARVYDGLGLDPNVRTVAEFAIQTPGDFAWGLWNKGLYIVGLFGRSGLPGGIGTSWLYVGMWLLAIAGAVRMLLPDSPARSPAVWLPAAGALSHAAPLVLVFPHGYTDRLILPLYPLLIPYAAHAVEPLAPVPMRIVAGVRRVFDRLTHWFGRHVVPVLTPVIRERRNWLYLAYGAAVIHWLGGTELATALLLPAIALGVVLLARADLAHKVVAAGLWAAALVRIAVAGSLSPHALHDPLFWGIAAVAALGISAVTGRWRVAPGLSAAVAGACTMMATLLPRFPDFEVTLPALDLTTLGESIAALSDRFGPVGALLLMAVSLQAIVPGGAREARAVRLVAAARGALVAGLVLSLAGAVPGELIDARMWVVALGLLLGLVEAKARSSRAARAPRQLPSADSV